MLLEVNTLYFLFIAMCSALFPGGWWLVPLFMLCMGSSLYWVHRLGHTRVWKAWYEAHVTGHHLQQYTSRKFSAAVYRHNVYDTNHLNTWVYVLAAASTLLVFQLLLQPNMWQMLYLVGLTLLVLLGEERLHYRLHTMVSLEDKEPWLQYFYHVHHIHHSGNMKCNYAVLSLWLDWLYRSYKPPLLKSLSLEK